MPDREPTQRESTRIDHEYYLEVVKAMRGRLSPEGLARIDQTPTFIDEMRLLVYTLAGKDTSTLVNRGPVAKAMLEELEQVLNELDNDEIRKLQERGVQGRGGFEEGVAELIERFAGEKLQQPPEPPELP